MMEAMPNNNLMSNLPEERGWEYKQITVTRVPGYGFGIAVSGGRDNPHFASGDPSIAVSDVLASGPAERMLQVNDRIISVNGISLQNVDYATAVQVLRDSGDTVVLVVKRRTTQHQHSHSLSSPYTGPPLAALGINPLPPKVTLTKNSKKEDFGIVLGCKLFIKEISSKARDQLINTNQVLNEGDFITKINNTNCNDLMSLKEAKKIIDGTKDKLHLGITRDFAASGAAAANISHHTQSSVSTTGDDFLTSGQSYSNQNLYVQPPTRNPNLNTNGFEDKIEPGGMIDDKSNLAPRGRSRGPINDNSMTQSDNRNSMAVYGRAKGIDEPPRPPPPRAEDYYSSRRQLYDDDPIIQKTKQPIPDARFITFHKEGSVGIRLTGGNFVGIFVTAVQPGSPASLQGLQPGDKILKVNDMDMTGVTREEAVLFLLSLQDRIELIVQFCKEEYDSIVASQKGDSFYIKTHFHYESPAKGEMSFRSGDIFHVIDTLYNGVVGCWQVYRIGRNNQEVQKGIIPNKARAEELATAQFNATKKEMSTNESRGSFFRRRRSSNRRSKSLGKEHWDDILFSDTVSKFPAYERVILKHPGFTRPVILFGPIADVSRDKLIKDFPDKFISPQLDNNVDETKSNKTGSNIIKLSAIREVISTGKHALLDITPNAVERLNYAQLYPIVVFFKAETKIIVKQLRQGLPKSAHKSSKKLLEQCQKLDKVWGHIFSGSITLNDNTENWYRKVREIIDKQQSGALWMSESKHGVDIFSDIYFPVVTNKSKNCRSLPSQYRSRTRARRAPASMYENNYHLNNADSYYSPSQSSLYSSNYQQSIIPNQSYASSFYPYIYTNTSRVLANNNNNRLYSDCNNLKYKDVTECINSIVGSVSPEPIYYDVSTLKKFSGVHDLTTTPSPINFNPEECLSDDFLFPMSSLRLSYASSPESDLEHSPGPPLSPGLSAAGSTTGGRLTKASSDPSVVMADNSTTDVLPPYQPTYDSRYGFNTQTSSDPQTPTTPTSKDMSYLSPTSQDHTNNNDQAVYTKPPGIYNQNFDKTEYPKQDPRNEFVGEQRNDFNKNISHKRQTSNIHGHFNHAKGHSMSEQVPKEHLYGPAPDLPPRVDRAVKPPPQQNTPTKTSNGRSAHERLFGTKAGPPNDNDPANIENANFNNKISSLERSHNSKSDSLSSYDSFNNPNSKHNSRIIPNAHDDLKTTLSKIDPNATNNTQGSPSKYGGGRWEQNNHRHDRLGSKLDLKYGGGGGGSGMPPPPNGIIDIGIDQSPRSSREMEKELGGSMEQILQRGPDRERMEMYRYSRSPAKQGMPNKQHIETKTDYGKYSRNNTQEYTRSSHQDLSQSHLSVHQPQTHPMKVQSPPVMHPNNNPPFENGPNTYKPIPPPKPKNYKPPYKGQGNFGPNDGVMQPPLNYQHGKSHSNPVDQRSPPMGGGGGGGGNNHNYYYNMPQSPNMGWRYNTNPHGHYDMAPPYESRRHTSISYASRSEIAPIAQQEQPYGMDGGGGGDMLDTRPPDRHNIVDLQGSREQRGSAFELYRKPVHHNLRGADDYNALYGSQPNLANNQPSPTIAPTNPKPVRKLTKTQSFKHQKSDGLSTPKFFRKLLSKYRESSSSPRPRKKSLTTERIPENEVKKDFNRNCEYTRANERDVTSAVVDCRGALLVNQYWGVTLEVPPQAVPDGVQQEVYFVITDPRLCDNAPPLDLENGETMLSPLVMCGPQGTEFLKPVVLHIPHYANTLPSLGISLKATDSETDVRTDWDNILLPSNHAANSVAVKVDHF